MVPFRGGTKAFEEICVVGSYPYVMTTGVANAHVLPIVDVAVMLKVDEEMIMAKYFLQNRYFAK